MNMPDPGKLGGIILVLLVISAIVQMLVLIFR